MFSRSLKSKSRGRWSDSVLEESIIKVIRDGLNACRIPNYRVRERIPVCPRCHRFVGLPSEEGIPDLVGWIPDGLMAYPIEMKPAIPDSCVTRLWSRPLFIEVKRPKGAIESEAQKQFIERAKQDGGIAMFARGWDECADQLRAAGVKIPHGL